MNIKILLLISFLCVQAVEKSQATDFYIKADDPAIQYMGRIDFSNPQKPSYSFPGISIKAKFNSSTIKAVIKDFGLGGEQTTNYYNVIIDGQFVQKLQVNAIDTLYLIATGLDASDHTVELIKRTESSVGKSSFFGFVISSSVLLPLDPMPIYKMEFIGDSWTCGYGNEISTNSPNTGFHSINEDNARAWGYTVAKKFNAQYNATAISGRGLYRNNTGSTTGVLPEEFNKTFPGQSSPLWNFNNYIPDLVIIHLGTNDFYPETVSSTDLLDSALFVNKYIAFVSDIRTKYGSSTKIICAFGNSKSDWWPTGLRHLSRWRNYVNATVNYFNTNSDNAVYAFELTVQSAPYGEDWHPTIVTHNQMANQIAPFITTITGRSASSYEAPLTYNTVTSIDTGIANDNKLIFYPNPTSGVFSLDGIDENISWEIYDSTGRSIHRGLGKTGNIESLKAGMYFVLLQNKRIPFVKQ
ncbi:MAG: T9SS type A sorting domain-containing protein [Cytophagaceae bacterium]|nr:T9SS type A sorting domain-containing protein [Cytophagaceae bacterium]